MKVRDLIEILRSLPPDADTNIENVESIRRLGYRMVKHSGIGPDGYVRAPNTDNTTVTLT